MENYIWPEITEDTPIEEVKRIHQQIWDYVIKHGEKPKTPYASNCAACEYDGLYYGGCSSCPIIWPGDGFCSTFKVNDHVNLFSKWCESSGEEKTELARQIRDLPWKFEVEENRNV